MISSFLLLLVVSVATPLVLALLQRDKHTEANGVLTYRWPRGLAYFLLASYSLLAFLLALLPLVFPDRSGNYPAANLPLVLAILLIGTLLWVYVFYYRVILDRTELRSGAFFIKAIPYSEVVSINYNEGLKQLVIGANAGNRIRIAQTIGDFASLLHELESRLPTGVSIPKQGRLGVIVQRYTRQSGT